MYNTQDIYEQLKKKYDNQEFRIVNGQKTIEIQGAHFIADKPYIVREPNYEYFHRELEWYDSQSLFVEDIPHDDEHPIPKIWKNVSDDSGKINSNYGWCVYSDENYNQYQYCLNKLVEDNFTREAVMIYNRPSMVKEAFESNMRDFMCTFAVQCFLNYIEDENVFKLNYHVYMRSNDAVFGFNNDILWHRVVQERLVDDLNEKLDTTVIAGDVVWTAGSLHVYERHFKYLENNN